MILGWHCDSNLAARLALYRGRVDTLMDKAFGYHCDHTRVAAANNKGRKTTMNSHDKYIWNVSSPYIPEQAETWGWPDVEIEEVRLDRDTSYERYTAGLCQAIEPATVPFTNTSCEWHLFDDLTYDLRHTLPFVCDQVLTYPRSTAIMVVGSRADFVAALRHGVARHGLHRPGPGAAGMRASTVGRSGDRDRPVRRPAASRTDLFLFEFGLATPEGRRPGPDRPRGLADRPQAAQDRRAAVPPGRLDRGRRRVPRGRRTPRRFIGVNVIYNKYWPIFTDYVGANINPFCSQVLAGIPLAEPVTMKEKILKFRKRAG